MSKMHRAVARNKQTEDSINASVIASNGIIVTARRSDVSFLAVVSKMLQKQTRGVLR